MIKQLLAKTMLAIVLLFGASLSFAQTTFVIQVGPGGTNTYSPANVTCTVGDTISFVWVSGFHPTQTTNTTTIPLVDMDGSGGIHNVYKTKMVTAGVFPYECTAHGGMGGTITVNPGVSNTPLLTENFNYTLGTLLSANGYTAHSGAGTNSITVVSPGLTYSGSTTNGVGNAVSMLKIGEDVNKTFTTNITTGNVYASFLVRVDSAKTGDYFFHFSPATIGSEFRGKVFVKTNGAGGLQFGISKSGNTGAFDPTSYVIGTTYQLVVKYKIVSGTTNDSVKLFVNPVLGSPEPVNANANAALSETDATAIATVAFRQGSSILAVPGVVVDGLIVGQTWTSVTPLAVINPTLSFNPTTLTVNENAGTATVTVNMINTSANATSVDVKVKGGTATAGSDYTFTTQTVTFPANSTTAQSFTIPIIDDIATEADETIQLVLRNPTNAATLQTDSILTITIPANDAVNPSVKFNPTTLSVNENAGTATVTVNIANPNANATSVDVLVKGGLATSASDYTFTTQTVTFPANSSTAQTFTIPIIDDTNAEGDETIILALRNATNSSSITLDSILTITIPTNDQIVSNTPLLVENFNYPLNDTLSKQGAGWNAIANVGVSKMAIKAGLSFPNSSVSNIGNAVLIGNAGEDLAKAITGGNLRSGNLYASFLMNVSAATTGDYFFAMLDSALSGANYRARTFIKASGSGYRIGVTKSGAAAVAGYNSTDLNFGTTYQVVVKYSIIAGATNDSVKLFVSPVLGAPEPAASAVGVTTESDITISSTVGLGGVALRQGSVATSPVLSLDGILVGQTWASVTPFAAANPSVKFNPTTLTVNENAGTATVTLNVTNANANATSVDVKVKGGTATAGSDYTFTTQTVTFPANSTTAQSFTIPIIDDVTQENDETIVLALSNSTNSSSIEADSILTITIPSNDLTSPVVNFVAPLSVSKAEGTNHVFSVSIANPNANATGVQVFVKSTSTATGADYSGITGTGLSLTFPANSSSNQSENVNIVDDAIAENAETIVLVLRSTTNGATIGNDSLLTIIIPMNDQPLVTHFINTSGNVNENAGSATINVMAMGATTNGATTFDVVLKGGTASLGGDYTFTKQTITIPAGKDSTVAIVVPIINDNVFEADETIVLAIRNINNSGVISTDSIFTLTIKNDDILFKNIQALKVNDVNGVSVLKDTLVYIKGIVYGVDMQGTPTSMQYTLIDPTGGVGIFRSGTTTPPIISLVPEEGDSVKVYGKVGEFNGLTQVNMDSIILISKGNALKTPRVTTSLDEATESDLVIFKNAEIIDTIANTASGTTLRITNGTDSLDLRIDADVSLFGQPIVGKFDVIGLGGQYDATNPKNSGYQLLPRSLSDVIPVITIVPTVNIDSAIYNTREGNGTKTVKVSLSSATTETTSVTFALTGGSAIFNSDFTFGNPGTLTFAPGATEATVTFTITDDAIIENNETINFAISDASKCILGTLTSSSIVIGDNDFQGVNNNKSIAFNVYPNPANQKVNVVANENIQSINIINMIGQTVLTINNVNALNKSIDITELSAGVYNVIVSSENGSSSKRLIIK